ncbi:hypothetical protein ACQKJG_18100 [Priestia megaterium]|uniref:hypothetical protein n=1 Tax=Priestia megaterium TaxID=1404 RepID=UPI003D090AE7
MEGLFPKYRIERWDGQPIHDFKFVLSPHKDDAAMKALIIYCKMVGETGNTIGVMEENAETFRVRKFNGSPINSAKFVLSPERGLASLIALNAYAEHTPNEELRKDIKNWVQLIVQKTTEGVKS